MDKRLLTPEREGELATNQQIALDAAIHRRKREGEKVLAILMSLPALKLLREAVPGKSFDYHGVPIELHDEWGWGWMLRTDKGLWPRR